MSPAARSYLMAALDIVQQHAILGRSADWAKIRRVAFSVASGAHAPADTYQAIRVALSLLGDPHSRFLTPGDLKRQAQMATQQALPRGIQLDATTGDLILPAHIHTSSSDDRYADQGVQSIKALDQGQVCGWVVDLRKNGGGDMWPMLAAVGPILGEGEVGAFVDLTNTKEVWSYRQGRALLDDHVMAAAPVYRLRHPRPPVAVLTDNGTTSSAEAILVAFRGRPHTRSFGQPTAGVPTALGYHALSDGAQIAVTEALDVDRAGHVYRDRMAPDEVIAPAPVPRASPDDLVVAAALRWLRTEASCGP
jgi:C-terminal processing protease CtpA/Prc